MRKRAESGHFRRINGVGDSPVDKYPRIDKYIPDAEIEASSKFDKTNAEQRDDWDQAFLNAMNIMLSKAGLRVL